jgi:hypothetical protein
MTWSPCVTGAAYQISVDWVADGDFIDPFDNVTDDVLQRGITVMSGRDQNRQLSPARIGSAGFALCNVERLYSPENTDSDLYGNLEPGRETSIQATFDGTTYPLFYGRLNDFTVNPDRDNRSVEFTALDGLSTLQGVKISTALYQALRTGEIVALILDEAGWPADRRDIDTGASFTSYWWEEGTTAFDAIQKVVNAEGPPALAYIAPDGTFTFRDRHHRLLRAASLTSQADFAAARVECDSPPVTGLDYTPPFTYQHGWRDIVNDVLQDVDQRAQNTDLSTVWNTESPFSILTGQTVEIKAVASDPFLDAVAPTTTGSEPDIVYTGTGVVSATLSRTSGQSTIIRVTSVGGPATVLSMRLRARAVPVGRTIQVREQDPASITLHGLRTYPQDIQLATANDVEAVAEVIVAQYANRRPLVSMRVVAQDPTHLVQIFTRTLSDLITIRNDELGLDAGFYIEQIEHTITRINPERPPIHAVVFGCEKERDAPNKNPFTFDKAGAGFDDGFFDPIAADDPDTVWIWDTQSEFDTHEFGT